MLPKANPSIYTIKPYIGGDVTPLGFSRRIVLASNENPFGPSPESLKVLHDTQLNLASYPSGRASKLVEAISDVYGWPQDHIVCGNGSEEILHLIAKVFAGVGDDIVSPTHGFLVYRIATFAASANPVFYEQPDLKQNVDAILKAITPQTKVIYIDNPANPLGSALMRDDLKRLIETVPKHVVIALDEAYAEFVEDDCYASGLEFLKDHQNLIILRTFSKVYGLAGMRVGYAFAHPDVLDPLHRVRAPFNVGSMAQSMAASAIRDHYWVKKTRDHTIKMRAWTKKNLEALGYEVLPSFGNFLLINFESEQRADEVYQTLGKRGIMIRPVKAYGLPQYLRVSIGTEEQMHEFIDAMQELK